MRVKTLAQTPTVLVVSSSKKLLQSFNLVSSEVGELNFVFVNLSLKSTHNKLSKLETYKIVWLVDLEDVLSYNQTKLANYLRFLSRLNAPINVVCFTPSFLLFKTEKLKTVDVFLDRQKQFIALINQKLVAPQIIKGYEVVDISLNTTPLSSLLFFVKHLDKGVLISPKGKVCYLDLISFFQVVIKLLFKPHSSREVVVKANNPQKASDVFFNLKRVYEFYFKKELVVKAPGVSLGGVGGPLVATKTTFDRQVKFLAKNLTPQNILLIQNTVGRLYKFVDDLKPTRSMVGETKKEGLNKEVLKIKSVKNTDGYILGLDGLIQDELKRARQKTKTKHINILAQTEAIGSKKNKHRRAFFLIGLVMVGLGLITAAAIASYQLNQLVFQKQLTTTFTKLIEGQQIKTNYDSGLSLLKWQTSLYEKIIDTEPIDFGKTLILVGDNLKQLMSLYQEITSLTGEILIGSFKLNNKQLSLVQKKQQVDQLIEASTQASQKTESLLNVLESDQPNLILNPLVKDRLINYLKQKNKNLKLITMLKPVLEDVLTNKGVKNYLLVYEDSNELRSSGGVIAAVATLSFNNGRLTAYKVYGADEIDQKIPGMIEPPETMRQRMSELDWKLVDVSWANLPSESTKQMLWFLSKGFGFRPDGLIVITQPGLANLVRVVGEIYLPATNEAISAQNLGEKILFHAQANPQGFYQYQKQLLDRVINQLVGIGGGFGSVNDLFNMLKISLESKSILLDQFGPKTQVVFDNLFWSGKLTTPNCPSVFVNKTCQIDVFAQIENSFGLNKANHFITRSITQDVVLSQDGVRHRRKINYTNLAKTAVWPKGDYLAYTTVFLPTDATEVAVKLNGKSIPLEIKKNQDKQLVSFNIRVPINSQAKLVIEYKTPSLAREDFSYLFFDFNQPGSKADAYSFKLINNLGLKPKVVAPTAEINNNIYLFSQTQNKNLLFGFKF